MLTHGLFNYPAHFVSLIPLPLLEVLLIDRRRSGVREHIMVYTIVATAGVLHNKQTVCAWVGPEASPSKRVVKAMGLPPRVHQVLLEIVNCRLIRVYPLHHIFIELYAGVPLGLHIKWSLINLVDVMILVLHLDHDNVVGAW